MQEKIELNLFENRIFTDLLDYTQLNEELIKKKNWIIHVYKYLQKR